MPISYHGFLLRNEKGETVAQSTKEFATYALANNAVYKMEIVNTKADKTVCLDRKLITGASPLASDELGKLATKTLLEELR